MSDNATAVNAAESSTGALTPYITVSDAARALDWYAAVLGARPSGQQYVMEDGRVGHAELTINGGRLMLSDAFPEAGVEAPIRGARASSSLHLQVDDVDAVVARAAEAGAMVERKADDNDYGRVAIIRDPFGHRWMFNGPVPGR